jgi:ribulose-5-phosphate 4-epimerase/fuculose-1-phosphate aldolase
MAEIRHKVAISSRVTGSKGLMRGATGHVSARIPNTDQILIKSKGPDQTANEFTTERDIITIDIEGQVLEAPDGLQPPNETEMHLAVYRRRPEVLSVIHSHPDWVVLLLTTEAALEPIYQAYNPSGLALWKEELAVFPRSVTITTDELGEQFMDTMGEKSACLLLGHGICAAGHSVEEATSISMNLQELARMNYMARVIGTPKPIPDLDADPSPPREGRGQTRDYDRFATFWKEQKQWLAAQGRSID